MKITVARLQTKDGKIPLPPDPAYMVIADRKPAISLTAEEMDELISEHFEEDTRKITALVARSYAG